VFGSHVLSYKFLECFGYEWPWPPCSLDMNPHIYFLWGLPRRLCVLHQLTQCSGVGSRNWKCCWRDKWHAASHSWQLHGSFTVGPWGQRISYWMCVHMMTTCTQTLHKSEILFMSHMFLHPRDQKLLHVFLNTCITIAMPYMEMKRVKKINPKINRQQKLIFRSKCIYSQIVSRLTMTWQKQSISNLNKIQEYRRKWK
jgi:hypothetical protein